jgi:hypothetical protein
MSVSEAVAAGLRRCNESDRGRRSSGRCEHNVFESAHGVPSLKTGLQDQNHDTRFAIETQRYRSVTTRIETSAPADKDRATGLRLHKCNGGD